MPRHFRKLYKDLFVICNYSFAQALVLGRMLEGDFQAPKLYSIKGFAIDLYAAAAAPRNAKEISIALRGLEEKDFIKVKISHPGIRRSSENYYHVNYDRVIKQLRSIKFKGKLKF